MDLRGLVKLDSKEGFLKKGRNKEEKKDAYKKPGRATNTASEARTLRPPLAIILIHVCIQ